MAKKVKKARRSPINDLRDLTRRRGMSEERIVGQLARLEEDVERLEQQVERLIARDTEALWIITNAVCPFEASHAVNDCEWCNRTDEWMREAK